MHVPTAGVTVEAEIAVPEHPGGVVLIASGRGGARRRPRSRRTADRLWDVGWATVLLELLTPPEERLDEMTGRVRFDVGRLAGRLTGVLDWLEGQDDLAGLPVGLLGAGTGAAAALLVASHRPGRVGAVVSRGVRPSLGGATLSQVVAPVLLVAAEQDRTSIELNDRTAQGLGGPHDVRVVPDALPASALDPEDVEALVAVVDAWFGRHLRGAA